MVGWRVRARTVLVGLLAFAALGLVLVGTLSWHPAVPEKPSVVAVTSSSVVLEWDDVPSAVEYQLSMRESEWLALPLEDIRLDFDGSSAVISQLPAGTNLAFGVRARAPIGRWSEWSEVVWDVNLPTIETVPSHPGHLTVSGRAPGKVELDWQDVSDANSYQVHFSNAFESGAPWTLLPTADIDLWLDGSGAVVHGLPESTDQAYRFKVRAANQLGNSEWSEVVKAPAALDTPSGVTGRRYGPGTVMLNWVEVFNANSYQVGLLLSKESVYKWAVLPVEGIQVSVEGSSATVGPLPEDSELEYSFVVRAINAIGESNWSGIIQVPVELHAPEDLTAAHGELGAVLMNWGTVPAADTYQIRLWHMDGNQPVWVQLPLGDMEVSLHGPSAILRKLPAYAGYFLQVRAVDAAQVPSPWSEVVYLQNQEGTQLPAPPEAPFVPATFTPVPTPTLVPTFTPTPTATLEPIPTLEPTPTPTPTPRRRTSGRSSRPNTPTPAPTPTYTPTPRAWLDPNPGTSGLPMHEWTEFTVRGGHEKVSVFFNSARIASGSSPFGMTADEACAGDSHGGPYATGSGQTVYAAGCEEGDSNITLRDYSTDDWDELDSYDFQVVE